MSGLAIKPSFSRFGTDSERPINAEAPIDEQAAKYLADSSPRPPYPKVRSSAIKDTIAPAHESKNAIPIASDLSIPQAADEVTKITACDVIAAPFKAGGAFIISTLEIGIMNPTGIGLSLLGAFAYGLGTLCTLPADGFVELGSCLKGQICCETEVVEVLIKPEITAPPQASPVIGSPRQATLKGTPSFSKTQSKKELVRRASEKEKELTKYEKSKAKAKARGIIALSYCKKAGFGTGKILLTALTGPFQYCARKSSPDCYEGTKKSCCIDPMNRRLNTSIDHNESHTGRKHQAKDLTQKRVNAHYTSCYARATSWLVGMSNYKADLKKEAEKRPATPKLPDTSMSPDAPKQSPHSITSQASIRSKNTPKAHPLQALPPAPPLEVVILSN